MDAQLLTIYLAFSLVYASTTDLVRDEQIQAQFKPVFKSFLSSSSSSSFEVLEDKIYEWSFVALAMNRLKENEDYYKIAMRLAKLQLSDGSFPAANHTIMRK